MNIAQQIRKRTAERNRELAFQAVIEFVLGIVFSAVTFGFVFWITFIFTWWTWHDHVWAIASGVTGVFFFVSVVSAWRQVNPLESLSPMTVEEAVREDIAQGLGYAVGAPVFTRRSISGAAVVLIGGPANVFESWSSWRHRLPVSGAIIRHAGELMIAAQHGARAHDVQDARSLILLRRLGLVRFEPAHEGEPKITLTTKGRDVVFGEVVRPNQT